ncbi:hypothetical protein MFIFM68171_05650 [Madurella fahalii]|uniref:F-box domain-containing protein n=1 Tax=Madurella fahalii TaxID=1157608 RepID=A0ABQ0GCG1_9PEZI
MGRLDKLPTEILFEITAQLEITDVRKLRLVNRTIGAIADRIALKEICFTMCKQDFVMIREIMKNPVYAAHVTRLAYVVQMLTMERQTLQMYTNAIRKKRRSDEELHKKHPHLFERPPDRMTKREILDHYNRYLRLYEDQDEILTNELDYEVLKEVIAKLPNLRDVVVSDCNELRIIKKPHIKSHWELHSGKFDDGKASTRHLRAILKGVEESKTQLQSIRAALIYLDILNETQFGLHSMASDLLENLTTFQLMLLAVEEREGGWLGEDPVDITNQIAQCRALVHKGALRRILDRMPNLVELDIQFFEAHCQIKGTFPSPAALRDVIPLDRVWPRLKTFSISGVETERQEIASFLVRHKQSLESFDLCYIRLTSTSWYKLLPYLKSQFCGTQLKDARLLDSIIGRSEDMLQLPEAWSLGHPDHDERPNRIGAAVTKYLLSPRKRRCPLRDDNMLERLVPVLMPESDDEWSSEMDDFEFVQEPEMGPGVNTAPWNSPVNHFGVAAGIGNGEEEEEEANDVDDSDEDEDEDGDDSDEDEDEDGDDSEEESEEEGEDNNLVI